MKAIPTRILLLILVLLILHVDAMAVTGVLTKSFYVPVVKGEYAELSGDTGSEPAEMEEQEQPEKPEEPEEPATPTNLFVIVSEPIQIEVDVTSDEEMPVQENEEIEAVESPQLEEEIE